MAPQFCQNMIGDSVGSLTLLNKPKGFLTKVLEVLTSVTQKYSSFMEIFVCFEILNPKSILQIRCGFLEYEPRTRSSYNTLIFWRN